MHNLLTTPKAKTKHLIKPYRDLRNVGLLFMTDKTLQSIRERSGPLANSCEYQTHYWALVGRVMQPDGSVFDMCIPTVFFNYKQEVTGARIDFELSDVNSMSTKLEPVHNTMVNKYMQSPFIETVKRKFPNISFMSTSMNQLHKHP